MSAIDEINLEIDEIGSTLHINACAGSTDQYPPSLSLSLAGDCHTLVALPLEAVPKLFHGEVCELFHSVVQGKEFLVRAEQISESNIRLFIQSGNSKHAWKHQGAQTKHNSITVPRDNLISEIISIGGKYVKKNINTSEITDGNFDHRTYQSFLNARQIFEYYQDTGSVDNWRPQRTREQIEAVIWDYPGAIERFDLERALENTDIIERIVSDLVENPDEEEVKEKYLILFTKQGDEVRRLAISALDRHFDSRAIERLHGVMFDEELLSADLLEFFARHADTEAPPTSGMDEFSILNAVLEFDLDPEEELSIVRGLAENDASEAQQLLEQIAEESKYDQARDEAVQVLGDRFR